MDQFLIKQEEDKFSFIKRNFEKEFLHQRFTQEKFFEKIDSFKLFHSWNEESIKKKEEEIEQDEKHDYSLCVGINEDWGYIDIYYLYDLCNKMIITEIEISEE
jgi:hypothetical protein